MTEAPDGRRLLSAQELAEAGPPEAVRLPVELIDPNPHNPRQTLPEVEALAANIVRFGLMQPVFVRRMGERYEVLAGHRRRAAFLWLREQQPFDDRWRAIPAVVVSADDETANYMLISAQAHIVNWKPREQAMALERLALAGMTLNQIGERLNRSIAWASKRLRVFADVAVSALVQTGQLSTGVAEELLGIKDFDTRQLYAQRAVDERWSQDQARGQVRAMRLDRQLTDLSRRARELADLLSAIDPKRIPISTARDLWVVAGRIQSMARAPQLPTIEAAEKIAGVTPRMKEKAESQRRNARRRPKPPPS